jgi:hypothetical protein
MEIPPLHYPQIRAFRGPGLVPTSPSFLIVNGGFPAEREISPRRADSPVGKTGRSVFRRTVGVARVLSRSDRALSLKIAATATG